MRKIKVHFWNSNDNKIIEISLEQAEEMLKETYADSIGGFVANQETGQVITEIGPDVKEILIIDHMIGGG